MSERRLEEKEKLSRAEKTLEICLKTLNASLSDAKSVLHVGHFKLNSDFQLPQALGGEERATRLKKKEKSPDMREQKRGIERGVALYSKTITLEKGSKTLTLLQELQFQFSFNNKTNEDLSRH